MRRRQYIYEVGALRRCVVKHSAESSADNVGITIRKFLPWYWRGRVGWEGKWQLRVVVIQLWSRIVDKSAWTMSSYVARVRELYREALPIGFVRLWYFAMHWEIPYRCALKCMFDLGYSLLCAKCLSKPRVPVVCICTYIIGIGLCLECYFAGVFIKGSKAKRKLFVSIL